MNNLGYKTQLFHHAQIFLSYSWDDKSFVKKLHRQLSNHFWVWFDNKKKLSDRSFLIGESVVPTEKILKSDFFLCIASDSYFETERNAFKEWEIASHGWLETSEDITINSAILFST
jgi:hypothetical protein